MIKAAWTALAVSNVSILVTFDARFDHIFTFEASRFDIRSALLVMSSSNAVIKAAWTAFAVSRVVIRITFEARFDHIFTFEASRFDIRDALLVMSAESATPVRVVPSPK